MTTATLLRRGLLATTVAAALAACSGLPLEIGGASAPEKASAAAAKRVSALSGRAAADGPTLVVKIDNTAAARPQAGLEDADVVYVEPVEGGLTRLAAVFSTRLPESVGPVRSARISDVELFAQYGKPAFAYSGAQSKFLPTLRSASLALVSADDDPSLYHRRSSRPAPYNLFADAEKLLAAAEGATTVQDIGFRFGKAPAGGTKAASVTASWRAASSGFTWSATAKRWLASTDGTPAVSTSGKRLAATTVLVQYVDETDSVYKDKNGSVTPYAHTVGTGEGLLLRNGKAWKAQWSRSGATTGTRWTVGGQTARLAAGQVWVLLVDKDRPVRLR
ncbi:DUF3048 domain-containing protein [Motilibacter aurantiacus]|uniref:DUF3048 domain-containing protein n=1 Tax=Motilibacter aurantiacus TaxID=2714955 RepID=UPI001408BB06|nr:DUF3048 domain-containing protein [Motilibacter aurantiacus]NHC46069.1 DUF3048 domain-containing protein [Motilibacter aurantiacus]